jgi:hypothetical protein
MPITKGFRALLDEANAVITTYSVEQVRQRLTQDPTLQVVDIRDPRELEREGTVPGAMHAPRGMLEFWVDPDSPYYKPAFGDENKEYRAVLWRGLAQCTGHQGPVRHGHAQCRPHRRRLCGLGQGGGADREP